MPLLNERITRRFGPFPPSAFCCTLIIGITIQSATLMPMLAFPTHGYSDHLFDELSSPGIEGFSSFHIILHTMSPLLPRR
jgi:hypothetical protein